MIVSIFMVSNVYGASYRTVTYINMDNGNKIECKNKIVDDAESTGIEKVFIVGNTKVIMSAPIEDNQDIEDELIVNAIYWAEGGPNTNHPYGILTKYKTTTPREACFNTVRNNRKRYADYGHRSYKTFLRFLASRYCPIGAENDPTNLNVNWLKNVQYYITHPKEV